MNYEMNTDLAGNDNAWPDDSLVHTTPFEHLGKTACSRPLGISEYTPTALFLAVAMDESRADASVLRIHPRKAGKLCRRCLETFKSKVEGIKLDERERLENLVEMAEMLAKQYSRHQQDAQDYSYVAEWCAQARTFRDKADQCCHLIRVQ